MQLRTTDDGESRAALFAEHDMSALHVAFSSDGECLASGDFGWSSVHTPLVVVYRGLILSCRPESTSCTRASIVRHVLR